MNELYTSPAFDFSYEYFLDFSFQREKKCLFPVKQKYNNVRGRINGFSLQNYIYRMLENPLNHLLSCSVSEDSTDVGEEDSFLGQTSVHTSTPQTFSYFSQVSSSSDPFGNIGQSPLTTAATSVGQSAFSKPLTAIPFTTGSQDVLNAFPPSVSKPPYGAPTSSQMGMNTYQPSQPSSLPPSNFGSPPQGTPQQGYNPYRHTPVSSRANPYITPPQLQQCQTPGHPSHPPPSGPPVQMYQTPPGSLPPVCRRVLCLNYLLLLFFLSLTLASVLKNFVCFII